MWPFTARKTQAVTEAKGMPMSALITPHMVTSAVGAPESARAQFDLVESNLTASIVVRRIAAAAATIKFHVIDEDGSPDWDHPVSKLLDVFDPAVGRWATIYQMAVALQVTADTHLLRIDGARGIDATDIATGRKVRSRLPQRLEFLDPTGVTANIDNSSNSIRDWTYNSVAGNQVYQPEEIINIRHYWPTQKHEGMSILRAASAQMRAHNNISNTHGDILDNNALPPALVTMVEDEHNTITDEHFQTLRHHLERWKRGGDRTGQLALLRGQFKILEVPRATDLLSLDTIDHLDARVSAAFGYPYVLLSENKSGGSLDNGNNQAEAEGRLWKGTIVPDILSPIASGLSNAFGISIGYDLSETPIAAAKNSNAWARQSDASEILTLDERRAMLGYDALPNGTGNVIFRPAAQIAYQGGLPLEAPDQLEADKQLYADAIEDYFARERETKQLTCDH